MSNETPTTPAVAYDGERRSLHDFTQKAYRDYAMYVILDRALPHIGDGLKPVQRRIVYAMSELGLDAGSKHKKSARTVGDVLGKYHPHGDSACYEAMVLMAQPFSYRYPLIDGQGNWGAPDDPKSFAAMRYTEARLAPFADVLLREVGQGTVDWVPNFDGTLQEPELLPSRLPHVLLNGAMGIAVGMSTDIPPHNLREVAAACVHLLDKSSATLADLLEHIQGPDYPTEADIITPRADIERIYTTGSGSIRLRARYERENGDLVITALPYQTSGSRIVAQIATQVAQKKLPMIDDIRDESDHENATRLVIVLRSRKVDADQLMEHLFATTDLERSYRVNLNVIGLDGRPQVRDLRSLLSEWLDFRRETVRRRLSHRLEQVQRRLHLLEGLLAVYAHIDEVIAIIREADKPKPALMERFKLSEVQAEAILEIRLRQLARLEEIKLRDEQAALDKERAQLEGLLGSDAKLRRLIRKEIEADAKEYGDARRSRLRERAPAQALDRTQWMPSEPITVVLSEMGWVRAAKGHDVDPTALNYRAGDGPLASVRTQTNQSLSFLDAEGRAYTLAAHTLPSARGFGEPLTGRVSAPSGARFIGAAPLKEQAAYLLASSAGYGFRGGSEAVTARNRAGKTVLTVAKGAEALPPLLVAQPETARVACATAAGRLLIFPYTDLPELQKGRGNRMIQLDKGGKTPDRLVAVAVLGPEQSLVVRGANRHKVMRPDEQADYQAAAGRKGRMLPRGFQSVLALEVPES